MSSEKELRRQRRALVDVVKKMIYLSTSNPFCVDEVSITLPQFSGMNEENIKPVLELALGYIPQITLYQETSVRGSDGKLTPVVLIVLKLK